MTVITASMKVFSFQTFIAGAVKTLAVILGVALGYLFDQQAELDSAIGAGILLIFDTLTGFAAAVVAKEVRTSRKMARVLTKSFGYLAVIIVAAVAEKTIGFKHDAPIVTGILWLIIATEGYSILENVEKMGVGKFTALRKLLGKHLDDGENNEPTD